MCLSEQDGKFLYLLLLENWLGDLAVMQQTSVTWLAISLQLLSFVGVERKAIVNRIESRHPCFCSTLIPQWEDKSHRCYSNLHPVA